MTNTIKWEKTRTALRELLDILTCSKCKKSLHTPQQFLQCGHFACISCVNSSNNTCIDCLLESRNKNFINDDTIQRIVQACSAITREIGCQNNNQAAEVKSEQGPSNDINNTVSNKDSDLKEKSTVTINSSKKLSKKVRKRKKSAHLLSEQEFKKPKLDRFSSILNNPNKINKRSPKGETVLLQECRKNRIENVKVFLDAGADPNIPCFAGWTPLQESVDFNYYEVSKLLLEANANVNAVGFEGRTALHEAARNNNLQMIKLLLNYGANKDVFDQSTKAPVSYCISEEAKVLLCIDVLPEAPNDGTKNMHNVVDNKNTSSDNNDEIPSTSKKVTRNSFIQSISPKNIEEEEKKEEEEEVEDITLNLETNESQIKKEDNASEELAIVYEKINSINLSIDSREDKMNHIFPESPGKENSNTKANTNSISLKPADEKLKTINENKICSDNAFKSIGSQESIIVIRSQNSNPFDHQINSSQIVESSNVYVDSEDIIDVEN